MFLKTPEQQCSGVFVCLVFIVGLLFAATSSADGSATSVANSCRAQGELQWANVDKVVDGDTLHLTGGRKVRVIAINAPELGRGNKPGQPLAQQARKAVLAFFNQSQDSRRVGLQLGTDSKDRYGRQLAHLFRADGASLSAYLLAQGLAWQVVVPPNDRYWHCLEQQEKIAQQQAVGVWDLAIYPPKNAASLTRANTGFQRLQGVVSSVNRSRDSWWIQLGAVAIRLRDADLANFGDINPPAWQGQRLSIRGWVVDRSRSQAVKQQGYSALMMSLRHPAMLK